MTENESVTFLSPEQVVRQCGLSRRAVSRAIERGELRASRLCSRLRIRAEDLGARIASNRATARREDMLLSWRVGQRSEPNTRRDIPTARTAPRDDLPLSVRDDTPATDIGQIADEVAARETARLPVRVEAEVRRILQRAAHRLASEGAAECTKGKAA